MLTIFRGHLAECKFRTRKHKNCQCPIWYRESSTDGKLGSPLTSEIGKRPKSSCATGRRIQAGVSDACDKFIADAIARNLSQAIARKIRHLTNELKNALGPVSLRSDPLMTCGRSGKAIMKKYIADLLAGIVVGLVGVTISLTLLSLFLWQRRVI